MLRQSPEGPGHVVRRRGRGGTRSQVPGSCRGVHSPTGDQHGQAGGRGRGEGRIPRPNIHRQTHRRR